MGTSAPFVGTLQFHCAVPPIGWFSSSTSAASSWFASLRIAKTLSWSSWSVIAKSFFTNSLCPSDSLDHHLCVLCSSCLKLLCPCIAFRWSDKRADEKSRPLYHNTNNSSALTYSAMFIRWWQNAWASEAIPYHHSFGLFSTRMFSKNRCAYVVPHKKLKQFVLCSRQTTALV